MVALIVIGLPTILLMIIANRYFRIREKKLEVEAMGRPKRRLNMRPVQPSLKHESGFLRRSSRIKVLKRLPRSRHCGTALPFLVETRFNESV
ncbi:MAG TPA: hypothetical protein VFK50_08710 [Sphingomicrobium sp.]|nr:hypothetical protein [Sphingomicrobium sp.]